MGGVGLSIHITRTQMGNSSCCDVETVYLVISPGAAELINLLAGRCVLMLMMGVELGL